MLLSNTNVCILEVPDMKRGRSTPRTAARTVDEVYLQPWFASNEIAWAIRRIVPQHVFHKMRYYFEDWGCLVCGTRNRCYESNGMCGPCARRIWKRLFASLERRSVKLPERSHRGVPSGEQRVQCAMTLLSDLASGDWSPNRMKLRRMTWSNQVPSLSRH
jgi:hypothetical protein